MFTIVLVAVFVYVWLLAYVWFLGMTAADMWNLSLVVLWDQIFKLERNPNILKRMILHTVRVLYLEVLIFRFVFGEMTSPLYLLWSNIWYRIIYPMVFELIIFHIIRCIYQAIVEVRLIFYWIGTTLQVNGNYIWYNIIEAFFPERVVVRMNFVYMRYLKPFFCGAWSKVAWLWYFLIGDFIMIFDLVLEFCGYRRFLSELSMLTVGGITVVVFNKRMLRERIDDSVQLSERIRTHWVYRERTHF